MSLSVLQNLKTVYDKPYPHVVIENALPEKIYEELEQSFPLESVTSVPPVENVTHKLNTHDILESSIPNVWKEFCEYHTSKEHVHQCLDIFHNKLENTLGKQLLNDCLNQPILPRGIYEKRNSDPTFLTSECQLVVHKPLPDDQTTRTTHIDNPAEIYAGLLYMKPKNDLSQGGDFVIHDTKPIKKVRKRGGRPVDSSFENPVKTIPYQANTFVMFLNLSKSVHSVTKRKNAKLPRRSVNIIAEFNEYVTGEKMYSVQEL